MKWVQIIISLCCYLVFILMSKEQYDTFRDEPTGSALSSESVSNLPFPAITICDNHFENARAYEELGFPMSPFGRPQQVKKNPLSFYDMLIKFGLPIVPSLWRYHFTLDKQIPERKKYALDTSIWADNRCRVGNVQCGLGFEEKVAPDGDKEVHESEVPAGKWISRFLADSYQGTNHLCHTLVPNITVNFNIRHGNSISLKWKSDYSVMSSFWTVYVHDKNEHVVLESHAIRTLPAVTVQKIDIDQPLKLKRKVLALPRVTRFPSPSSQHPCGSDSNYSENWCDIQWGWQERINILKDFHGENLTCRLPGVWAKMKPELPVCNTYETAENGTLGFLELGNKEYFNEGFVPSLKMRVLL